jgi:hypothetical protein
MYALRSPTSSAIAAPTTLLPVKIVFKLTAINVVVPSKGGLPLAFNCDSQQINSVVTVKYKCGPAQSAGEKQGQVFLPVLAMGYPQSFMPSTKGLPPER